MNALILKYRIRFIDPTSNATGPYSLWTAYIDTDIGKTLPPTYPIE